MSNPIDWLMPRPDREEARRPVESSTPAHATQLAPQGTQFQPTLARNQLILLALMFRYTALLFWVGAATVFTIVVALFGEAVVVTIALVFGQ